MSLKGVTSRGRSLEEEGGGVGWREKDIAKHSKNPAGTSSRSFKLARSVPVRY
ncbi:hypothetical protein SAY87_002194 [Trapa incisa]|uniref:Uncharacterized protein n=2 Tax=Trapa TaxID=22665 RepID=A0AAN7KDT2_TRANT|nr:hypothetical protein SAY87_002194 [Trapa incisa]KAK4765041.1 hypothetical protein SAY86_026131 [Trapa natans]